MAASPMFHDRSLASLSAVERPVLDDITIVIPTLGRPILQTCLAHIAEGSAWPRQLIVIDQGNSPDGVSAVEGVQALGIHAEHVPSTQRGRAAGVNRGLERVRTRFVAITDDDCFVDADWLQNMVTHLRANPMAIVSGRVEAVGEGVIFVATSLTPAIYRRPRLKFDAMSGGNLGMSLAVVERVGLFDEDSRLRTAEDGDYAYRALRAGVPIIYAPDVCVWHYGWRDGESRTIQYADYARSHGGFYGKHLRKGDRFIALRAAIHHVYALRRWIQGTITRDRDLARNGRAYLMGLLPGILTYFDEDESAE